MQNKLKEIGRITNFVGLNGEVKLSLNSDVQILDIHGVQLLFYQQQKNFLPLLVDKIYWKKQNLILHFQKMATINDVAFLKNQRIYLNWPNNLLKITPDWMEFKVQFENEILEKIQVIATKHYHLLQVKRQGQTVWIPLVNEYIAEIKATEKILILKNLKRLC